MTSKNLVKYNNDFNIANLTDLNKVELDIFIAICSKFTKNKTDRIVLEYDEVRELSNLTLRKYSKLKFQNFMLSTQDKILKINFSVKSDEGFLQAPIFKMFFTPNGEERVIAELNDIFLNYLYDIPQKISFTQFELDCFLQLKSKYSKNLLRFFLQNYMGFWIEDFAKFKVKLGFPASQISSQLFRTLDKAILELEQLDIISNIKYEIEKARTQGSPIKNIKFTYELSNKIKKELNQQAINNEIMQNFSPVTIQKTEQTVTYPENPDELVTIDGKDASENNPAIYGPPITVTTNIVEAPRTCPVCNSPVLSRKDKKGKKYFCCENNSYWNLGNKNCNWQEYEKSDQ